MKLHLPIGPEHAPQRGLFNEAERKRFIMLSVLLVMVLGMFAYSWFQSSGSRSVEEDEAPVAGAPRAEIVTPTVDVAALRSLTSDATQQKRVLIETPALEQLLRTARLVGPDHFEPMGGAELDAARASELLADPDGHRGRLYRLHGVIEAIDAFDAGGNASAHYRGRVRLEGGGEAWFAVLAVPDNWGEVGQFVRIDGLFLKIFRDRAGADWIDAPLFVGQRLVRAYPRMEPVTALDPALLASVEDDGPEGLSGQPFEPYWALVSYARNLPAGAIDWDAAPLLDGELLAEVFRDGDPWRGKPFRFPASEIQGVWHQAQPENPLRVPRLVEGWGGNWDWLKTSPVPVVRFVAPLDTTDLRRGDYFTARAFFLKTLSYEPRDGGVAVAPFFVLHSIESYTPVKTNPMGKVFAAIALGLALMVILVYVSLMRDRRKAAELQNELRRRRQARRAQPQQT